MKKTLAKIVKSVVGGYFKLAYRWTWIIGSVMILQSSYGSTFTHKETITDSYKPGSLTMADGTSKYKYGSIDTGFFYSNWLSNTLYNFYGNDASVVRESHVPSAMVDVDGVLYTIDLHDMDSTKGANFFIRKYTSSSDGRSISVAEKDYYPWATEGSPNADSTPYMNDYDSGANNNPYAHFKNFFHNCLQPCIAQEMAPSRSSYMSIFFRIPPSRYFRGSVNEGILYQDFKKENLAVDERGKYYTESKSIYWFNRCQNRRRNTSYLYAMEKGNYKAWKYSSKVHLDFLGNTTDDNSNTIWTHQYNYAWSKKKSLNTIHEADNVNPMLCSRYVYDNGYVYSLFGRGYTVWLYRWTKGEEKDEDEEPPVKKIDANTEMCYLETYHWGHSESAYDYDFFIETGSNGVKILCFLAFGGAGSYSPNKAVYNWSSTYCSWNVNYATLLVQSLTFSETGSFSTYDRCGGIGTNVWTSGSGDWVQNVIYVTPYTRENGNYVNASNTSKSQEYRLYQNTHRMCTYTGASGTKYIIYCYCYPGKEPQLYLGYAQYWINAQNKIMLGPKFEFRKTATQWSESIANCFTSCSRIISMDCRGPEKGDKHLWITWMNEDNTEYRYFHILAKDLVGE